MSVRLGLRGTADKRLPRLGKRLPRLGRAQEDDDQWESTVLDQEFDEGHSQEKRLPRLGRYVVKRLPRLGLRSIGYYLNDEDDDDDDSLSSRQSRSSPPFPRVGERAAPVPRIGRASPFPRLGKRASPFPRLGRS